MLKKAQAIINEICTGFSITTKLDNHYTRATHRIFFYVKSVPVIVHVFNDRVECKNKQFLEKYNE